LRIELNDGELLELSDPEVQTLYETLLEEAPRRGAMSAVHKLRPALAWCAGAGTRVALDQFETDAVQAIRQATLRFE
jgi:hypothetical protein